MMNTVPLLKLLEVSKVKRENLCLNVTDKSCFVISCRTRGKSLFLYKNKTFYVKTGDILYIPKGSNYAQESENEEIIYIHFDSYTHLPKDIKVFRPLECNVVCDLFKKCYKEYSGKNTNYQYRCMSMLYEILSYMDLNEDTCEERINPCFESAIRFMNSHIYNIEFSIGMICRHCGISRTYFNLLFKKKFNVTPVAYINTSRINKAKFLLDSGDYSNDEIALLCGFSDTKYFYAVFKKLTGMTTKEYINASLS